MVTNVEVTGIDMTNGLTWMIHRLAAINLAPTQLLN